MGDDDVPEVQTSHNVILVETFLKHPMHAVPQRDCRDI